MTAGTLVPEALRLPAAPLLAAVDQAAHDRRTSVSDVLGKSGQKAYARARAVRKVTLAQVETVCDRLGCHPYELYGPAYQRLALASGSGPLEPEVTVTAWHLAACTRPIRPGELVGLVADVGPCCAGCCGLDRSVGSERTSTNMVARALGCLGIGVDLAASSCRATRWRVFDPGQAAKSVARTWTARQPTVLDHQGG